jgi:hypothetical protein
MMVTTSPASLPGVQAEQPAFQLDRGLHRDVHEERIRAPVAASMLLDAVGHLRRIAGQCCTRLCICAAGVLLWNAGDREVLGAEAPLTLHRVGHDQHVVEAVVADLPVRRRRGVARADGNPAILLRVGAGHQHLHFADIADCAAFVVGLLAGHHQAQLVDALAVDVDVGRAPGRSAATFV